MDGDEELVGRTIQFLLDAGVHKTAIQIYHRWGPVRASVISP